MDAADRWSEKTLKDGEWLRFDFDELSMIVLNAWEEWRVAVLSVEHQDLPQSGKLEQLPAGLDWERWDNDPKDTKLRFRPTYPSLPVVAKPLSVLNISPKGSARFFIGIPAWIEVLGECQGKMQSLKAYPTELLSKTWHGTRLAGSLGYALKTYARRSHVPEEWPAHDIVCSISIVNEGEEMLPFDRLYLETEHLAVYESEGRLWSNAASIHSGGEDTGLSDIAYEARPQKPHDQGKELTPAREGYVRRSTMQAAFSSLLGQFTPFD
ncbi:MAG: hypothetical protein R3242_08795 [Akkermansiaceae bacterium]|nr:hypothetical protein [Akkermansiaceae bacterium]